MSPKEQSNGDQNGDACHPEQCDASIWAAAIYPRRRRTELGEQHLQGCANLRRLLQTLPRFFFKASKDERSKAGRHVRRQWKRGLRKNRGGKLVRGPSAERHSPARHLIEQNA